MNRYRTLVIVLSTLVLVGPVSGETGPDRAEQLLKLAKEQFPDDWTDADGTLFRQTAMGEVAHYGDGDPAEADKWGQERVLPANRIEWLCTDREAITAVTHRGVQIEGARIEGRLILSDAKMEFPLLIVHSAVPGGMVMQRCHLQALFLTGTHTGPISADGLRVEHSLHMQEGFHASGEVRLLGATIGGELSCVNGHFSNPDGVALHADRIDVKGGVFLHDEFKAEGEVRLGGATIGGGLECSDGHFSNPDGNALSAFGIDVKGYVHLRNGFEAEGEVSLVGAKIGGPFVCNNGHFSNPSGVALHADGIDVAGGVFLDDGFKAEGGVRLLGASIGGDLACVNGHFSNPSGAALDADGIDVKGSVFLSNGFKAEGTVRLLGATIGGDLSCENGHFSNPNGYALNADGIDVKGSVFLREQFRAEGDVEFTAATVGDYFHWRGVEDSDKCTLRLESAKIGTLWDDEKSWPAKLYLDGLVYDRLASGAPTDSDERLRWLQRQGYAEDKFVPQPYVQLAKTLQEMGHEADARRILIAKQEDPARVAAMAWYQCLLHRVFGATIAYGYRPWQALLWIVAFIALGAFLFHNGSNSMHSLKTIEGEPPVFNAFVYSLDAFVPLVDLHQAKYRLPKGIGLRLYLWLHIGFGWILTTLLVVGLTGLVRK